MTSVCISSCVKDARVPVRATYVNLYKWPESDAEFIRSMSARMSTADVSGAPRPRVVDSISCRQIYLRSYTFSREEESNKEEKMKCCGGERRRRQRRRSRGGGSDGGGGGGGRRRKRRVGFVVSVFRRLLSCTTKVDVVG